MTMYFLAVLLSVFCFYYNAIFVIVNVCDIFLGVSDGIVFVMVLVGLAWHFTTYSNWFEQSHWHCKNKQ